MLKKFIQRWQKFGRKAGDFQARLLLSLFYFIALAPFALILRMRGDALALKPGASQGWKPRTPLSKPPSETAKRQY